MSWLQLNGDDELIVHAVFSHNYKHEPTFHGLWLHPDDAANYIDLQTDSPNYYIEELPVRFEERD